MKVHLHENKNAPSKDLTQFRKDFAKKDPTLTHSCKLLSIILGELFDLLLDMAIVARLG